MPRIIAGEFRGRRVPDPERGVRPTSDRAREALFSILYSRGLDRGIRFVDLFSGTGAAGFEALSRGASHVWFADERLTAIRRIQEFAKRIGAADRCTAFTARLPGQFDTVARLAGYEPVDVLFADPPFDRPVGFEALAQHPAAVRVIGPTTLVVWERERSRHVPTAEPPPGFKLLDLRRYGRVEFLLFSRAT
jgi:16S rRNA (guanine966-N2)-methyltransferase